MSEIASAGDSGANCKRREKLQIEELAERLKKKSREAFTHRVSQL